MDHDQLLATILNIQDNWDQQRIVQAGLNQRPHAADHTYTATAPCIIWPQQGKLSYATHDKQHKNGWSFHKLLSNEIFFFRHQQWMYRDSGKPYCLIKIEWLNECTLLTLNHNQKKMHRTLPKVDAAILQLFKHENAVSDPLACKSLIGLCLSQTKPNSQSTVSKSQLRFPRLL